jgi:hypothetical protein
MYDSVSVFHTTPNGLSITDVALNKTQTLLSKNTVQILLPTGGQVVENRNILSISD